ncbi:MAG: TerC/Alx family metal homeostasis membrane protein [Planctomycetia bacterium]|nr:TerC/Alx family metal homeostasis membrane protein [Planctomycetia bacterium]
MLMPWLLFISLVLLLLALDLGVFHRSAHVVTFREAVGWSAVWLTLGLTFAGVVFFAYEHGWCGLGTQVDPVDGMLNTGTTAVEKYLTGYVVEKSLSIDNIFVIAMIFGSLAVPAIQQHRVLFWGVIGALAMRAVMIVVGAKLIAEFHWILYVFASILIVTAVKMLASRSEHADPSKSLAMKLCRTWLPVADGHHGQRFLVRADAEGQRTAGSRGVFTGWMLTPLAVALIMVESADLVFAVDSIPAIFAITGDPFLVFTSNVFAMLGLRSLYFALAGMMTRFQYLKVSLAAVLLVVGGKMLAAEWLKQVAGRDVNLYLLGVIIAILAAGIVGSMLAQRRRPVDDRLGMLAAQAE